MNALEKAEWKRRFRNVKLATFRETGKKPGKKAMSDAVDAMLKIYPRPKPKENWETKKGDPMKIGDILSTFTASHAGGSNC